MSDDDALALLARSARLKLFVVLRRSVDRARMNELRTAHLRWMIEQEKAGALFLSGPIAPYEGVVQINGLSLLRADSLADARRIVAQDPFVQAGAVEVDVAEWTANEGRLVFQVSLSDSSAFIE